jgi:hypothetical protein
LTAQDDRPVRRVSRLAWSLTLDCAGIMDRHCLKDGRMLRTGF